MLYFTFKFAIYLGSQKYTRKISQFLCGISPHFVSTGGVAGFICIQEPSVCHVVSIRKRVDPGNENECLCVAAISLLGCCHLANFDLFSRYLQGKGSRLPFRCLY